MTTALSTLKKLAEEIANQHASGYCDHYGDCELVEPFVEYLQEHQEEADELESWIDGHYNKIYDKIFFDSVYGIKNAPENHVSNVRRFKEICKKYNVL
jgi:hypothetical protein